VAFWFQHRWYGGDGFPLDSRAAPAGSGSTGEG